MSKNKLNQQAETKLSSLISNKANQQNKTEKTGFISSNKNASKMKSFRLRPDDFANLKRIVESINSKKGNRKIYNDSDIIRGMINFIASSSNIEYILEHIKDVS